MEPTQFFHVCSEIKPMIFDAPRIEPARGYINETRGSTYTTGLQGYASAEAARRNADGGRVLRLPDMTDVLDVHTSELTDAFTALRKSVYWYNKIPDNQTEDYLQENFIEYARNYLPELHARIAGRYPDAGEFQAALDAELQNPGVDPLLRPFMRTDDVEHPMNSVLRLCGFDGLYGFQNSSFPSTMVSAREPHFTSMEQYQAACNVVGAAAGGQTASVDEFLRFKDDF